MRKLIKMPVLEQASEGQGGGGTPTQTQPKADPVPPPAANTPPPEPGGDKFDEFGYQKPEGKSAETKEAAPPKDAKVEDKKIDTPVTGYGAPPVPVVEEKKEVVPPVVDPNKPTFELKVEGLTPEQVTAMNARIKEDELTQKQAQNEINRVISANAKSATAKVEAEKANAKRTQETRVNWYNELKGDTTFGGDKFQQNVQRSEKVIDEMMPEMKKFLTDNKAMLPPYVVKGLMRIGEALYATESMVQGGPHVQQKEAQGKEDPNAFLEAMYPNMAAGVRN